MHFRVAHETVYRYDVPVTLGPHLLRLSPRTGSIRVGSEAIDIEPAPAERREATDSWGNCVTRISFAGTTTMLRIACFFDLDTDAVVPLPDQPDPLPWMVDHTDGLGAFRAFFSGPAIRDYAEGVAGAARHHPVAFLDRLAGDIAARTNLGIRPDGHARTAEETLTLREGACRDVTVLFLEASRALGLPGRFVSGYQARPAVEDGRRHLHAWAEVFLPGSGWRGWDVTHGTRVTGSHVALCAAPTQIGTMPIEGGFSFAGLSVKSTLDYSIAIAAD